MPLEWPLTAAFGLVLGTLAHAVGWPLPRGGSQAIADALAGLAHRPGWEIVTGHEVRSLAELPPARAVLLDVTPRQVLTIAGERCRQVTVAGWKGIVMVPAFSRSTGR